MKYTTVTARLEDVSSKVVNVGGRVPLAATLFDATIDGIRYQGLRIRGTPNLKNGMTVTAALRRAGDWRTLAGWMNHQTHEIEGVSHFTPRGALVCAIVCALVLAIPLYLCRGTLTRQDVAFFSIIFGATCLYLLVDCRKALFLRRLLNAAAGWMAINSASGCCNKLRD